MDELNPSKPDDRELDEDKLDQVVGGTARIWRDGNIASLDDWEKHNV